MKTAPRQTAAQVILLAADDLMTQGATEFTEWDLTMASWIRDRNRFGLRGYSQDHPDHKRVMMEIMGKKPHNPVMLGQMEKIRPNTYRLTPRGRLEAKRLRAGEPKAPKRPIVAHKPPEPDYYDSVAGYVGHAAFQRWREDPDQPRQWADVLDFLGGAPDGTDAAKRVKQVRARTRAAIDHCNQAKIDSLSKEPARTHPPIHFNVLAELFDFLQAMEYRFPFWTV
jgi:DNA-binding PadR family transcriptional regulator